MSYRTKNKSELTSTNPLDRLATPLQIGRYIKSIINGSLYDYHETEAFRVTEVITDTTYDRGSVLGQFTVDPNQPILGDVVRPLFGNGILQVPVAGEQVAVIEFNGKHYYIGVVNTKGQVRENIITGLPFPLPNLSPSKDGSFKRKDVKPIKISEGCTLYEGRFGQSIHLDRNKDNDAPVIRIGVRNQEGTELIDDSFDNSDSMIVLTSDGEKFTKNKFEDTKINGKKILLKSDGIFISSNDVRLGSSVENDLEPVVKGNELKKIIDLLLDSAISTKQAEVVTKLAVSGGAPTPETVQLGTEITELESIKASPVTQYLSNTVKTK
tara:strand:+ start:882 stop:1856 length:975 start_codon:yes stop_codon:yes gene_type:complete